MHRRVVVVVVGLLASSCVDSNVVTCSDGRVCPAGYICDDARGRCLTPDEANACVDKADLDPCSFDGLESGLCAAGACIATGCGNGVLDGGDSGEVCDDGNVDSDDGCSFDCSSTEICGNGIVDARQGEACDDGDSLSHDGCGSCQPESPAWERADQGPDGAAQPTQRMWHAMAYDAARGQVVMFGGQPGNSLFGNDTWLWNGTTWISSEPAARKPYVRYGHAMTYDSKRRRVILFGGIGRDGGSFNDTWEWNGTTWTEVSPSTGNPPPRVHHSLAYDAARDRVVLFGGVGTSDGYASDTWEWDGTAWTEVTPSGTPPVGRTNAAMAYDPVRGRTVLFGGRRPSMSVNDTFFNDTWEWDGGTWTNVTPASNPAGRSDHALAFDPTTKRVVLYGGFFTANGNPTQFKDVHEWNGSTWSAAPEAAETRFGHAMVFDVATQQLVVFGGAEVTGTGGLRAETWARSPIDRTWSDVTATVTAPESRQEIAMAYDSARGRMVVFGGSGFSGVIGDTWEWGDGRWSSVHAGGGGAPVARESAALAYHADSATTVLFGGRNGATQYNDTWQWDGASWSNVTPTTSNPVVRHDHAMAYDSARGRLVLFGGLSAGVDQADTWEWNGTAWSNVTPASGNPPARYAHGLAYDASRRRVVLFGGRQGVTRLNDTWEWDGSTWTMITPQSTLIPLARDSLMLAYDAARGRVVLYGGSRGPNADDTWDWDGALWRNIPVDARPQARTGSGFAYDTRRSELVLFGGQTGFLASDTWTLRYDNALQYDGCYFGIDGDDDGLVGCDDHDCYGICSPTCNPSLMTCAASGPRCGDGECQDVESKRICPDDCDGAPPAICGDFVCEMPETSATCPGDCAPPA